MVAGYQALRVMQVSASTVLKEFVERSETLKEADKQEDNAR